MSALPPKADRSDHQPGGANIAAAVLLLKPDTLAGAILFRAMLPVCTENLDSDVMVMKSTKDRVRFDASGRLNRTRDRRIFIQ
jgi:predicted esterase